MMDQAERADYDRKIRRWATIRADADQAVRQHAVAAQRAGMSGERVAVAAGVTVRTVHRWLAEAGGR